VMCLPFQHEYGKWSEAIPNSMNSFSMNRQSRSTVSGIGGREDEEDRARYIAVPPEEASGV